MLYHERSGAFAMAAEPFKLILRDELTFRSLSHALTAISIGSAATESNVASQLHLANPASKYGATWSVGAFT